MPTIADYLDNSYEDDFDDYESDVYYLHIPRAIVKKAETENGGIVENSRKAIENGWGWLKDNTVGRAAPYTMLPPDPNDKYNNPIAYHTKELAGGNGIDDTVINDIASQTNLEDWGATAIAWDDLGAKVSSVAANRTFEGNRALKNITDHIANSKLPNKEQQDQALQMSTTVNDYTGVAGKTWINPSTAGNFSMKALRQQINPERVERAKQRILKQYGGEEGAKSLANTYNKNFFETEVVPHDYDNTFFGWFKDPAWSGAARYATPWLAYGIPLSAIGSMMGTNALWAPTLLGALGAGAYGYGVGSGALKDFSESDFGKMLDTIHTTANKPIGAIWNYIDEGTGRVFNNMTTGPMRYRETPKSQPQQQSAPAQNAQTSIRPATTYNSQFGEPVFTYDSQPEFNYPRLSMKPIV